MPAQGFIGLSGPEFEMDIERGKVRDFASAVHAPISEYLDGYHPPIPPTFLVTGAYTWGYSLERPRGTALAQIDHDLSVPLHAEESYIFHAALPRAGDRLKCVTSLEDVTTKTGKQGGDMTFLTMLTTYKDENSILIAEQRAVTVTTSSTPDADDWAIDIPPYEPNYPTIDAEDPLRNLTRTDSSSLNVGDSLGDVDAGPLMMRDIVRYQGASGEDNPLHYDVPWAKSFGYPAVFGLGMHQAGTLASYGVRWLGTDVRSFKARFRNVYWPGDTMIYHGTVEALREENGQRLADLKLTCRRPNGDGFDAIVDAWMTIRLNA